MVIAISYLELRNLSSLHEGMVNHEELYTALTDTGYKGSLEYVKSLLDGIDVSS